MIEIDIPGFDYMYFWSIGKALLDGLNPYDIRGSFYPPATTMAFAILALVPFNLSFGLFLTGNIAWFVHAFKRRSLGWLFFMPAIFMFTGGQNDFFFFALIPLLRRKDWTSVVAATLLTLKPQIAIIILPWFLVRWLRDDPRLISKFIALSLILHTAPVFFRPDIYSEWLPSMALGMDHKAGGIGIWQLNGILPTWIIALSALLMVVLGLLSNEKVGRTLLLIANPVLTWYDAVFLMDTTPWWILTPLSIAAFAIAYFYTGNNGPYIILPLASIAYQLAPRIKSAISIRPAIGKRLIMPVAFERNSDDPRITT